MRFASKALDYKLAQKTFLSIKINECFNINTKSLNRRLMKKDLDWNHAIVGNEDWKAACDSEIFTNFVGIILAKEQKEKAIKKAAQEQAQETEDFMNGVPNPLRANEDYGKYQNEDADNPFDHENNIDVSFGTDRDAIADTYQARGAGIGNDSSFDKGNIDMFGDANDDGAVSASAMGGGDTSADYGKNGFDDDTDDDNIADPANSSISNDSNNPYTTASLNAMIEADAMRLYDENIKRAELDKAERNLGLADNMYYQVLKAEKGVE